MDNEVKIFSNSEACKAQIQDQVWNKILATTSQDREDDMANRIAVYSKVMEQYDDMIDTYNKMFSGYAEIPILSNQYFNASMASYVRSFSGFVTVERNMDQPTSLFWYNDVLGVVDNRIVLPNIGQENLNGINARFIAKSEFIAGQLVYSISTNKKLIPGSVSMQFVHAADPGKVIEIKDDRQGNLLAPAGILGVNADGKPSVNYLTGLINFTLGDGFVIAEGDTYSIIGYEDVAGDPAFGQLTGPGNNRFKVDMKNIQLTAEPDMLVAENNLMAIAASQKAMGFNPQEVSGQKLTEMYTKLVNQKLTREIMRGAKGDVYQIPMREYMSKFTDFNSRLDAFQSDLVNIDTMLARRTMKATKATCYMVGEELGNWFRKLRTTGNWTDNTTSTYVNDLLGYFNGIPVLRHLDIPGKVGYALHKTPDGNCAPLARGLYLPLTSTPIVGNYSNPTQFANGIFYQEVNELLYPELIQKFTIDDTVAPFDVRVVEG